MLRSHAMTMLYREVSDGLLDEKMGRIYLDGVATLKIRLLGDRVSRSVAWKLARQLGWDEPTLAEYLAVASLQADVLVAGDPRIAEGAEGIIPLATYDDLRRRRHRSHRVKRLTNA